MILLLALLITLRTCMQVRVFWQHKDVTEMENNLNKEFANICDWVVDNKLFILVKNSFW